MDFDKSNNRLKNIGIFDLSGGEGGIRTHGTREGTTVFETAPIDHSGTSPYGSAFALNLIDGGAYDGVFRTLQEGQRMFLRERCSGKGFFAVSD